MATPTPVHEQSATAPGSRLTTSVTAALATRADELARAWLERVRDQLGNRPHDGFPGRLLLDLAPVLARWTVRGSVHDEMPREVDDAVRALVLHRLDQDHLLEEVMVELRILEDIVFEAADDEMAERGGSATEGLVVGALVAHRISAVMTHAAGVFNEQVEDERRSDRRKLDSFTRTISHEMRTPIGAAFTAARLLEDVGGDLPQPERERMLGVVTRGLARATDLLESAMALALARAVDGADRTHSLREVVDDVVAAHAERAIQAGVRVEVSGPFRRSTWTPGGSRCCSATCSRTRSGSRTGGKPTVGARPDRSGPRPAGLARPGLRQTASGSREKIRSGSSAGSIGRPGVGTGI
jgi:signal transduction histidine kinase